ARKDSTWRYWPRVSRRARPRPKNQLLRFPHNAPPVPGIRPFRHAPNLRNFPKYLEIAAIFTPIRNERLGVNKRRAQSGRNYGRFPVPDVLDSGMLFQPRGVRTTGPAPTSPRFLSTPKRKRRIAFDARRRSPASAAGKSAR